MTQTNWPVIRSYDKRDSMEILQERVQELSEFAQEITRLREIEDVPDFTGLPNKYVRGRVIARVPTSATDVQANEAEYDRAYDDSYMYILLTISGSLTWCRIALTTSW